MRISIIGESVYLRDWKEEDLPAFEQWNTGQHAWMELDGPYYPKMTPEEVADRMALLRKKIADGGWADPRKQLVVADAETDALLGTVSWYWQSAETNWKSIGVVIYDPAHWQQGYGYAALRLWVDYLFAQDVKLARLDLRTWSGNAGMMALGRKLGFLEEARFRKARIVGGEYYDGIGMGILREEWLGNNRKLPH